MKILILLSLIFLFTVEKQLPHKFNIGDCIKVKDEDVVFHHRIIGITTKTYIMDGFEDYFYVIDRIYKKEKCK